MWYHVLSWYSNTLCPFACDAAKSNFPKERGTTVSRKMRKSSLPWRRCKKMCNSKSIKISWHFAVWWSEIFFSQQPFSAGGHRIYSWRWARIPRIGNWRLKDRRLGGCCWDVKIRSTIFDRFCAGFYTINHFPETQIAQSWYWLMACWIWLRRLLFRVMSLFSSNDLHQFLGGSCNQVRWEMYWICFFFFFSWSLYKKMKL